MSRSVECRHCKATANEYVKFCTLQNVEVPSYKCDRANCKMCEFAPAVNVIIPVGRCDTCPLHYTERTPRAGYALDYFCKASNGRKIVGYVEWDSEIPPVPDWCPFRAKEENK